MAKGRRKKKSSNLIGGGEKEEEGQKTLRGKIESLPKKKCVTTICAKKGNKFDCREGEKRAGLLLTMKKHGGYFEGVCPSLAGRTFHREEKKYDPRKPDNTWEFSGKEKGNKPGSLGKCAIFNLSREDPRVKRGGVQFRKEKEIGRAPGGQTAGFFWRRCVFYQKKVAKRGKKGTGTT